MINPKEAVHASLVRAKSELEQALANLESMPAFDSGVVSSTAHALNNYLVVAEITLDLLGDTLQGYPDERVQGWLLGLRQVTNRMNHATSQLINFSASGEVTLVFSRVDVVKWTEQASRYYQRIADRKQIRILFEPAADLSPVRTDRAAAAAVLDNLLSNAVKYSEPGKRVWVRVRSESASVVLSVQDEGPGLSLEDQAKLFGKGVRLSAMPTGGEPSSGYGLATAKELIGQLGGRIWCESAPGRGACFAFSLPVWHEDSDNPARGPLDPPI
jgi:signal transduction histidine kinase